MFWTGREDCYIRASVATEGRQSRERYTFPTEAYTARWFPKIWRSIHRIGSFSHRSHLAQLFGSLSLAGSLCDVFSTVSAFCSKRLHGTSRMDGQTKWPPTEPRRPRNRRRRKLESRKQSNRSAPLQPPRAQPKHTQRLLSHNDERIRRRLVWSFVDQGLPRC